MGERERGQGVGEEGHVVRQGGWAHLLQGGIAGGPSGPWGAQWGLWGEGWGLWGGRWGLWWSHDVTDHRGQIVVGRGPRRLPIRGRFSRRGRGCWSGAAGFPC